MPQASRSFLSALATTHMQYLFERLANPAVDGRQPVSKEQLQLDVMRQLQCILACRPWLGEERMPEAPHLLGFGMPAASELGRDNAQQLELYAARLKQLITLYEPRLCRPVLQLTRTTDPASPLRIDISGQLRINDEDEDIVFVKLASNDISR